jgi:hypothetical protein
MTGGPATFKSQNWQPTGITKQITGMTPTQIQQHIALQMQAQSETIKAARQKLSS